MHLDGVMVGREAYQNPYLLAKVDQDIFGLDKPVKKRTQVVEEMYPTLSSSLQMVHIWVTSLVIC